MLSGELFKLSVAALIWCDGQILLVHPTYKEAWDLPGGIVDAGETPLQALARELQEEIGVAAQIGQLLYVDHLMSDWEGLPTVLLCFEASIDENSTPTPDSVEIDQVRFYPFEEATSLVTSHMKKRLLSIDMRSGGAKYIGA